MSMTKCYISVNYHTDLFYAINDFFRRKLIEGKLKYLSISKPSSFHFHFELDKIFLDMYPWCFMIDLWKLDINASTTYEHPIIAHKQVVKNLTFVILVMEFDL